jgi:hypothetical protein
LFNLITNHVTFIIVGLNEDKALWVNNGFGHGVCFSLFVILPRFGDPVAVVIFVGVFILAGVWVVSLDGGLSPDIGSLVRFPSIWISSDDCGSTIIVIVFLFEHVSFGIISDGGLSIFREVGFLGGSVTFGGDDNEAVFILEIFNGFFISVSIFVSELGSLFSIFINPMAFRCSIWVVDDLFISTIVVEFELIFSAVVIHPCFIFVCRSIGIFQSFFSGFVTFPIGFGGVDFGTISGFIVIFR